MKVRVVVAGTRDLPLDVVRKALREGFDRMGIHPDEVEALAYGESGIVDMRARLWAEYHNVPFVPFPADWDNQGKAAGPIRNAAMAEWASEGVMSSGALVAVWDGQSRGTADMILNAHRHGLDVVVRKVDR